MAGSHLADFILKEHPDHKIYATKRWRSPLNNIAPNLRYPGTEQTVAGMLSLLPESGMPCLGDLL